MSKRKVRLIDANAAIDVFTELMNKQETTDFEKSVCKAVAKYLDDRTLFPSYTKVKLIKRGYWKDTGVESIFGGRQFECSCCGFKICFSPEHVDNLDEYERYCCKCGATMRKQK